MEEGARRAAEAAARASYGKLLAMLAARTRDIAMAEDALADAFLAALRVWPKRGVPARPDAWLLTAAHNAGRNAARHGAVRQAAIADLARRYEELAEREDAIPDERLTLLFVCAHPAIDPAVRTPLMLQTVLGLDAARIGRAFLVEPATMGQRLVRAKTKIRDAALRFEAPDPAQMPERLADVLDAIYAAYGTGWDATPGAAEPMQSLSEEAIYLGRLAVALAPEEPEAKGLLALMLHCEARRAARRDDDGRYVPLDRQDARRWSRHMIVEAESLLTLASRARRFGRYQCEAAIQSVHVMRPITGATNYPVLRTLHDLLAAHSPSLGVLVARAVVILGCGDAEAAMRALDDMPLARVARYQPYWAARTRILQALGRQEEADAARVAAVGLTEDAAIRAYLLSDRTA